MICDTLACMHTKLEEGGATSYLGLRIGIKRDRATVYIVQGKQKREGII